MRENEKVDVVMSRTDGGLSTPGWQDSGSQFASLRLLGAVLIWSVGLLAVNILPLVFQSLEAKTAIAEGELGMLGASFVLGTVFVTGTSPLWIQHTNWRLVTMVGLIAASAGFLSSIWASKFHDLLVCFAAIGAGVGLIQTPAYAVLGNARDPVRSFGIALFVSMILPAIFSFSLSVASTDGGAGGHLFSIIAVIFLVTLPFSWTLPGGPIQSAPNSSIFDHTLVGITPAKPRLRDYGAATAAPITASIAGGLFTGVIMAVYSFVGSIAVANGMSADITSKLVGFGLLGALVGSLVPTILERWLKPTAGLAFVVAVLVLVAYPAMLSSSSYVFGAGFVSACFVGTAGFAYFLAMVRSIDPTHRIYVGYTAFQSAGIAAATFVAGVLLNHFAPVVTLSVASGCLVVSWLIWLLALRMSVIFPG